MTQKLFIKTYGCQMNVYDSQKMISHLQNSGYELTEEPQEADLILFNTCHIREKAAEKLYSELGRLKAQFAKDNHNKAITIGVAGCVAQAEGEEIFKRVPDVDIIIGPQTYHRLPDILKKHKKGDKILDIEYAVEDKFSQLPIRAKPAAANQPVRQRNVAAFLTVQEGCDKFCSFCVVPYTRGSEMSRPVEQILREAQALLEGGVKEITLLGQNVNAWHGEYKGKEMRLGDLLESLAKLPGLKRLRYTTSHPRDMEDSLIFAHRDLPQLMPYLHLPVQSGSDKVLKAMNRQHDSAFYLRLIEKIRKACPDIALSGDFIVGFPGEEEIDFQATLELIKEVNYSSAYSFKYSPRPGTPGAALQNHIPSDIQNERLQRLQQVLAQQQQNFLASKLHKETEILLERKGRHAGQMIGRSPWLFPVTIDTDKDQGEMVAITITGKATNSLFGQIIPAN